MKKELEIKKIGVTDIATRRDGKKYLLEWVDSIDFKKISPIIQVYGFLFNRDGKIVIVNPGRSWRIPGGKPEKDDKNFGETLKREADEEADVEIENIKPLGYIKVTPMNNNDEIHYLLRYCAKIKKIKTQTMDIAEDLINERKFIEPKEFLNYCSWGDVGIIPLRKAIKKLGLKK